MATLPVERAVPILPVGDLGPAEDFYTGRLGFAVTGRWDGYLILLRGAVTELHLSQFDGHDPRTTAGSTYLRVADAAGLYRGLRAGLEADGVLYQAPASGLTPELAAELRRREDAGEHLVRLSVIEDKPWGMHEFAVIDPAGNLVRIGQPVSG
jgi:catechol 2,3-dioxygenase-like lactoylglutathione lyase family enzyme